MLNIRASVFRLPTPDIRLPSTVSRQPVARRSSFFILPSSALHKPDSYREGYGGKHFLLFTYNLSLFTLHSSLFILHFSFFTLHYHISTFESIQIRPFMWNPFPPFFQTLEYMILEHLFLESAPVHLFLKYSFIDPV